MKQVQLLESMLGFNFNDDGDFPRSKRAWHELWANYEQLNISVKAGIPAERQFSQFLLGYQQFVEIRKLVRKLKIQTIGSRHGNNLKWKAEGLQLGYVIAPEGWDGFEKSLIKFARMASHYEIRLKKHPLQQEAQEVLANPAIDLVFDLDAD